jgi:dipeptidase E
MNEPTLALDRFVLTLATRRRAPGVPRVCFLPTASGDPREQVTRFHERFGDWPCDSSTLSLFSLANSRLDPVAHLMAQDAIYVGGGSMRNMLAIWREHRIDQAVRAAWRKGTLLAGVSAGAMCWFEGGISMSGGTAEPVRGLGMLPGSMSVHLDGEPDRLKHYRAAIADGALPAGHAADDGAALLYRGTELAECVVSRPGARVIRLERTPEGEVIERRVPVRLLPGATRRERDSAEQAAVSELRALRAGPRRWQ